ncbi:hypothetical protein [Paraburkholderia sp. GAS32]|uniref:hypothetical protein n=1 Tax=Paraburkholderia sp. GAS32 TaxID=3035129 RepID=UPI003D204567
MTDRQDPAQDSLTEVTDKVRPHGATVITAEQGTQHFEQFCGYTCSAEPGHKEAMNARRAEAEADDDKWRSTFDENGRYLDPVTGFWESLNAEFYLANTQEWVSAYDDDEVGPVSGTRYPQRATLAAAQIKITKVDDVPLVEFRALPRDNVFPGHAEVVKLIETRVAPTNCINYDEQSGLGAYIVDGAETPTVGTILTLHHGETVMPVEQYWDQLNAHDWHYCFADAGMDAYLSGEANEDRLKAIAEQGGDDYEALYQAFRKHHNTGEPWRNAQWDKPQRPVNGVVVIPEAPAEEHAEEATHKSNVYRITHYYQIGDQDVYVTDPTGEKNGKEIAAYIFGWACEWHGHGNLISNLGIAAMMVQFYGFIHCAKDEDATTVDMYWDCQGNDFLTILNNETYERNTLRKAVVPFINGPRVFRITRFGIDSEFLSSPEGLDGERIANYLSHVAMELYGPNIISTFAVAQVMKTCYGFNRVAPAVAAIEVELTMTYDSEYRAELMDDLTLPRDNLAAALAPYMGRPFEQAYPCGNYPALGYGTAEQQRQAIVNRTGQDQRPPAINAEQAARIAPKTKAERWVTNFVLGIAALALAMLVSGMWIDLALFEWAGLDRLHQIRDGCILLVIALTLNFATGRVAERNDKPA